MDSVTKICSQCKQEKDLFDFCRDTQKRDGFQSYCKACGKEYRKTRTNMDRRRGLQRRLRETNPSFQKWYSVLVASAKNRAKNRGIKFELTNEFVDGLFERQGGICPYFGVVMVKYSQTSYDPKKVSIDRIDNRMGYTKENVVFFGGKKNKKIFPKGVFKGFLKKFLEGFNPFGAS